LGTLGAGKREGTKKFNSRNRENGEEIANLRFEIQREAEQTGRDEGIRNRKSQPEA
jgi:hypothetical protein